MSSRRVLAMAGVLLALFPAPAGAAPVTINGPVLEPLNDKGTGLCAATAISMQPASDFGFLTEATYDGGMNAFIEAHKADRVESVLRTLLDLSNNNEGGPKQSRGDFIDAIAPACKS